AFVRSIFQRDHPGAADDATIEAFATAILALDDSVPTGTYVDMCSKLPLVDPARISVPTLVLRGEFDGIAGIDDLLEVFRRLAHAWPSRPLRMVVPLSPGGFADVPGRILAARLSSSLGYNVFVENRPGAGGTIGADFVAKSAPDGYTLLFTGTPHVISAWVYKKLPYDPLKDFEPVALVASGPYVLVVNPQLLVHSIRELIAAAKARPGKIDYASSGNGSAQHLVSALFASMAGIELNHVPYKGSGPAMQDLL